MAKLFFLSHSIGPRHDILKVFILINCFTRDRSFNIDISSRLLTIACNVLHPIQHIIFFVKNFLWLKGKTYFMRINICNSCMAYSCNKVFPRLIYFLKIAFQCRKRRQCSNSFSWINITNDRSFRYMNMLYQRILNFPVSV